MNRHLVIASMFAGAIVAASTQAAAPDAPATTPRGPPGVSAGPLSLDLAYQAAKATLEACKANGFPNATVAVSDTKGVTLVILRAPAAPEPTIESARRKAYTVAKTGMSTADFAKSKGWTDPQRPSAGGPQPGSGPPPGGAARDPFADLPVFDNDRNLVPWGGGLPILSGGKIVGGIGLSGAAGPQKDEDCAKAGADAVKDKAQ